MGTSGAFGGMSFGNNFMGQNPNINMMMMMQQQQLMFPMGLNPMGMAGLMPNVGVMSSAAQFHQPAEKNQIKLFVGGLAFSTGESELLNYFQTFGNVENTIVMRDKATGRGRGFGFVLVSFKDE